MRAIWQLWSGSIIGLQFPEFCGERFSGILRKFRTFSGIKMFKSRINESAPQAPTKNRFWRQKYWILCWKKLIWEQKILDFEGVGWVGGCSGISRNLTNFLLISAKLWELKPYGSISVQESHIIRRKNPATRSASGRLGEDMSSKSFWNVENWCILAPGIHGIE